MHSKIKMQIFVQGDSLHVVEVEDSAHVLDVKSRVEALSGLAVADQVLSFGGCPLEDEVALARYNIEELSTLTVTGRVLGGSLSSALIV